MLYLSGVNYESINDAPGVSCVLFISGCEHNCKGCHSVNTHSFTYGTPVTSDLIQKMNEEIKKRPYLNCLVLSGGDPMYQPKEVLELLNQIIIPNDNLWCFSGFTMEQLLQNEQQRKLLEKIDVLVDGPFIESKRNVTLPYRGSENQRIIDVRKSLAENKIASYCE